MRRYNIVVNGKEFSLDVREVAADRFEVWVNDQQLDVSLVDEADLPQASITPAMASTPPASPSMPRLVPVPRAGEPIEHRAAAAPSPHAAQGRTLTAPMPGVITTIDVERGAVVKRGDTLMMLEAMKMFNAIRSPRDGVIAEIEVKQGETVAYGDALLHFQEQP
jgi:biotin carboxyl carrier protein